MGAKPGNLNGFASDGAVRRSDSAASKHFKETGDLQGAQTAGARALGAQMQGFGQR